MVEVDHLSNFRNGFNEIVYIADFIRYFIDECPDATQQETAGIFIRLLEDLPAEEYPLLGYMDVAGRFIHLGLGYNFNAACVGQFFYLVCENAMFFEPGNPKITGESYFVLGDQKRYWRDLGFTREQAKMFFEKKGLHADLNNPPISFSDSTETPIIDADIIRPSTDNTFPGKDTASMLIAALAVALGRTSDKFKRGGKLNQSAVFRAAEQAISQYGCGVDVTDRTIRKWLADALREHMPKLEE